MPRPLRRLPPHFSIDPATGDILATDPSENLVYRFVRDQIRHILSLDETLRQGKFDASTDVIPGGYSTFERLWRLDDLNAYGLAGLPNESGQILVTHPKIPSAMVLPRREDDEARDDRTYRQLVTYAARAFAQEQDKKAYHIQKRRNYKAARGAIAAHNAATAGRLNRSRASSVLTEAVTDLPLDHHDPNLFNFEVDDSAYFPPIEEELVEDSGPSTSAQSLSLTGTADPTTVASAQASAAPATTPTPAPENASASTVVLPVGTAPPAATTELISSATTSSATVTASSAPAPGDADIRMADSGQETLGGVDLL
ncbi:hypothetical protein PYCCODRAFT_1148132 [Trametes coccinea BRFM310]|uniref:Uncharacterized protein n=1 Tax=Trametes coccinea (strain BRFM310) TaxID=1353009 RepID=A0A1Y2I991_TRAC3|nr:hypothetical protein PYCCODRAFT_1148132 [Trametes coccinea BRFM310]